MPPSVASVVLVSIAVMRIAAPPEGTHQQSTRFSQHRWTSVSMVEAAVEMTPPQEGTYPQYPPPPTITSVPHPTPLSILERLTSILDKPSSKKFRLPKFDGKDTDKWPAFNADLNIAMEHSDYSPGMTGRLFTNEENASSSKKMSILINSSLLPPKAEKFYDAP